MLSLWVSVTSAEDLAPIPPDTKDQELQSLYRQAVDHIEKKEFNEGATIYLGIIRNYSGLDHEKHRRWSCYSLYKLFLWFQLAESNRSYFVDCPADLVAKLYGDVDREPILLFQKLPKPGRYVPNQRIEDSSFIIEYDITENGLVENVVFIKGGRAGMYDLKRYTIEYFEGLVFLPKIVDGKAVSTKRRRRTCSGRGFLMTCSKY